MIYFIDLDLEVSVDGPMVRYSDLVSSIVLGQGHGGDVLGEEDAIGPSWGSELGARLVLVSALTVLIGRVE